MGFLYTDCGIIFKCSIYWALLILTLIDFKTYRWHKAHFRRAYCLHVWNIVLFEMTLLKEQFTQKWKLVENIPSGNPIDEFAASSDLEKCIITWLAR